MSDRLANYSSKGVGWPDVQNAIWEGRGICLQPQPGHPIELNSFELGFQRVPHKHRNFVKTRFEFGGVNLADSHVLPKSCVSSNPRGKNVQGRVEAGLVRTTVNGLSVILDSTTI